MDAPPGPFAAFVASDVAYALDDGMPFAGWAPPLIGDEEARVGYEAGERIAVIAGDPADPASGLVLDRRNARLALRNAEPPLQLVYAGAEPALAEALWRDGTGRQCWARRVSPVQLRVARRPMAAPGWVEELLAYAPGGEQEQLGWPEFGAWDALSSVPPAPWVGEGALELIDADGWMLDAWEAAGITGEWRELGRRYDAPRAFGLPPEMLVKLAEPLGWRPAGRRWRKTDEVAPDDRGTPRVVVVTDAMFAAGAGASGEIVTTVTSGEVQVIVDLPSATARTQMRSGRLPGTYARPSTGAQVAVTAMLEAGGVAHDAIVGAVREERIPVEWARAFG